MKSKILFMVIATVAIAAVVGAGDIQVSCEPGLKVFLDGKFVGATSAREDGLAIMNVKRGRHDLRIEKSGFLPQTFEVDVLDLPIEVVPEEFEPVPEPKVVPSPEKPAPAPVVKRQRVGSLIVTSAPQNCTVTIDGVAQDKSTPHLSLGGLTEGEHTISFEKEGFESISGVVTIRPGAEITVRGNLKDGKVEMVHQGVGSLRLLSRPMSCTVHFRGEIIEKTRQRVNRTHIPAGQYRVVAVWRGLKVEREVLISEDQRTVVEVDFMNRSEPFTVSIEPE